MEKRERGRRDRGEEVREREEKEREETEDRRERGQKCIINIFSAAHGTWEVWKFISYINISSLFHYLKDQRGS